MTNYHLRARDIMQVEIKHPSFEGVPENVVWEFRRQIAGRMREQTKLLKQRLGESIIGTPLGKNIEKLEEIISVIGTEPS